MGCRSVANEKRLIDAIAYHARVAEGKMTDIFPDWTELPTEVQNMVCKHGRHLEMLLETQPTVDAVPVVHGRWEEAGFDGHGDYKECCSNCKSWSIGADKLYCPVCGAQMDGDGNA